MDHHIEKFIYFAVEAHCRYLPSPCLLWITNVCPYTEGFSYAFARDDEFKDIVCWLLHPSAQQIPHSTLTYLHKRRMITSRYRPEKEWVSTSPDNWPQWAQVEYTRMQIDWNRKHRD